MKIFGTPVSDLPRASASISDTDMAMKMCGIIRVIPLAVLVCSLTASVFASGPYAAAVGDGDNPYDPPVAGWLGPAGEGMADTYWYPNPGNYVNPAFVGWADSVVEYYYPGGIDISAGWNDPSYALGPALGDELDIVSLGEMSASQIAAWLADPDYANVAGPGYITLGFAEPIYNGQGTDIAIFENGFCTGVADFFAELAFVEVSTDGVIFARFRSVSLTEQPDPEDHDYLAISATDIYNLAGKSSNAHGYCWGTPFDLSDLETDPAVIAGDVDLREINFVRIVDIPGDGSFTDSTGAPIYDAWPTYGSGGFDLDAVGVLYAGQPPVSPGDANGDGHVNLDDFIILKRSYGQSVPEGTGADFDANGLVNLDDFVILKQNYGS